MRQLIQKGQKPRCKFCGMLQHLEKAVLHCCGLKHVSLPSSPCPIMRCHLPTFFVSITGIFCASLITALFLICKGMLSFLLIYTNIYFQVEHVQDLSSDFRETSLHCLVTEDNTEVLMAMEEFIINIINFEHMLVLLTVEFILFSGNLLVLFPLSTC